MAFHERWFGTGKQNRLTEELERVSGHGAILEIGSWEGRSTIAIAKFFPTEKIHVIDHWLGDLDVPESGVAALAAQRDVFADFKENCEEAGVWDRIVVHRMGWRDFNFESLAPIKFCFIDAQHVYKEVLDNLQALAPHMSENGIIAGDDFTYPGVKRAVKEFFSEINHCKGAGSAIWGCSCTTIRKNL